MTTNVRNLLANFYSFVIKYTTRRRIIATALTVAFVVPVVALAQNTPEVIEPGLQAAAEIGLPDPGIQSVSDVRVLIARAIRFVLGFVGLLALGVVLYGGYLWMTSAGNASRVDEAKMVLRNGLIGLAIIVFSFVIVSVLINVLVRDIIEGGSSGGSGFSGCNNCIARGGTFIEDHYPDWNERVPRDIDIIITFAEPVFLAPDGNVDEPKSLIQNAEVNTGVCGVGWISGDNDPNKFNLVFDPLGAAVPFAEFDVCTPIIAGDPNSNRLFIFRLRGDTLLGLTDADGLPIETPTVANIGQVVPQSNPNSVSGSYSWNFVVTTEIDRDPPRIIDVSPPENNISAINDTIIITFNEPVHPVAVTGVQDTIAGINFNNLSVYADDGVVASPVKVDGKFLIGNGYRQVWFVPKEACATTNSCNEQIYCLPKNSDIRVVVKTATLRSSPSCTQPETAGKPFASCSPFGPSLFDGVVDMSKNTLDGNRDVPLDLTTNAVYGFGSGDRVPDGPLGTDLATEAPDSLGDTFVWDFETNDQLFISAPQVLALEPSPEAEGIDTRAPFTALFNRTLLPSTNYILGADIYRPVRIYEGDLPTDTWSLYNGGFSIRQSARKACSAATAQTCSQDSDCTGVGVCQNVCSDNSTSCTLDNDCLGNDNKCGLSLMNINHTGLSDPNRGGEPKVTYEPRLGSTIKDRWQNCFYKPSAPGVPNSLYPSGVAEDGVDVNDTSVFGTFN